MKSALRFHGVSSAEVRTTVREFAVAHPPLDRRTLRSVVDALYATPWFDLHSAAVALLARRVDVLTERDAAWVVGLARRSACWAHVDELAVHVVGPLIVARPRLARSLGTWAVDESFWVRRVALLAQLGELRRGRGDFTLFARLAVPMLAEKEFFIRKAIGWVLREVSKKRPALVREFVDAHRGATSGLTHREATKYLPRR